MIKGTDSRAWQNHVTPFTYYYQITPFKNIINFIFLRIKYHRIEFMSHDMSTPLFIVNKYTQYRPNILREVDPSPKNNGQ